MDKARVEELLQFSQYSEKDLTGHNKVILDTRDNKHLVPEKEPDKYIRLHLEAQTYLLQQILEQLVSKGEAHGS